MTYPELVPETKDQSITKSLRLLCNGFKDEFAGDVYAESRMTELLHELASEFVELNIPVVDEDHKIELAFMLMETLDIVAR